MRSNRHRRHACNEFAPSSHWPVAALGEGTGSAASIGHPLVYADHGHKNSPVQSVIRAWSAAGCLRCLATRSHLQILVLRIGTGALSFCWSDSGDPRMADPLRAMLRNHRGKWTHCQAQPTAEHCRLRRSASSACPDRCSDLRWRNWPPDREPKPHRAQYARFSRRAFSTNIRLSMRDLRVPIAFRHNGWKV